MTRLRRVHGDDSVYEACCWLAVVAILLGFTVGVALLVAPK